MIFWRQSLFRFSRHLLADMLIFLTSCAIFFFFEQLCFFSVSPGGVGGREDPPYREHQYMSKRTENDCKPKRASAGPKHSRNRRLLVPRRAARPDLRRFATTGRAAI